jgi:hypothetical protein
LTFPFFKIYSISKLSNRRKYREDCLCQVVSTNSGAYQILSLHLTLFKLNSEAFFQILCPRSFYGDSCVSLTSEVLLCSRTDDLAEDLLSPAHTLLHSLKAAAVVATAFTPTALPIPTSAAAVISSEVAAASAVVAGAAADILSAAAVSGSAAAIKAAVNEVACAVLSAADDFSATVVAAAAD